MFVAENSNSTHDFLSKLGEKSNDDLETAGERSAVEDSLWNDDELFGQDSTAAEEDAPRSNTHDFLSKLGENPDAGLSSSEAATDDDFWAEDGLFSSEIDDSDAGESATGSDQDQSVATGVGSVTQDFLSQLAEKSDLESDPLAEGSTDDDFWADDKLFKSANDLNSEAAEPLAVSSGLPSSTGGGNSTQDFLSQLGEKPRRDASDADADADDKDDDWGAALLDPSKRGAEGDVEPSSDSLFNASAEEDDEASISLPGKDVGNAHSATDGELSIEDYMNKLLSRVGTSHDAVKIQTSPPEPSVSLVDKPAKSTPQVADTAHDPQPVEVMSPAEFVPRSKAPEQNLAAMRELANESARSAISEHAKTRGEITALTNFGIALIPMLIGGILIVPGLKGFLPALIPGLIAECIGLYYLYLAFIAVIKKDKRAAAPTEERRETKPAATQPAANAKSTEEAASPTAS